MVVVSTNWMSRGSSTPRSVNRCGLLRQPNHQQHKEREGHLEGQHPRVESETVSALMS